MSDRKRIIRSWYSVAKNAKAAYLGKDTYQIAILVKVLDMYNEAYLKDTSNHRITVAINSKDFAEIMSPRMFSASIKAMQELGLITAKHAGGQGGKIHVSIITKPIVEVLIRKSTNKEGRPTFTVDDILQSTSLVWA